MHPAGRTLGRVKDLVHEPERRRYLIRIDGQVASVLDYRELGDTVAFVRTFTNPPYRGCGLAAELVRFAVDDVESRSRLRIVPSCWYVEQWFDRHPDRRALLDPRTA
ncbi:GNAT family N-acetyltransferase [Agromyces bracchium]